MSHDRPWLAHYPAGVSHEVDLDQYPSICAVLDEALEQFCDRPAFSHMGRVISYADIDQYSRHFGAWLLAHCKLRKGDRVAIMMPNCLQYPIALFGALRAGLTVVNTNPMYTVRELRHQLTDSGAVAIVVLDNFAHLVEEVMDQTRLRHVVTTGLGDLLPLPKGAIVNFALKYLKKMVPDFHIRGAVRFKDALRQGGTRPLPAVHVGPDDIAFLQYTGGTTGVAKGAMLSHRNMVANMQQASAWIGANAQPGKELVVTALPLYHIFALTANCLVFMKFGGRNHLITNPRDMPGFVKELSRIPFTAITGVNTLFNGLLNTPGFDKVDFSHLHLSLGGGMAVQRAVAERWKRVTGATLVEAYGLTETAPAACMNPIDLDAFNGAIGLPVPSTEAMIRSEDGQPLPVGEIGELCIRGPQVMVGYWLRPDETAKAIDAEGWFATGDMARMDDRGFVYIVDRKKDMILVSGFNVYPNEVEDVIAALPGVLEVAAYGITDERSGEAVKVAVVRKDPALSAEQVISHARSELTGYKVPRFVEFREELPKTNVGKILRRELRDTDPANKVPVT